ncbi:MAG: UDP-N-acetylmuramoyl-L-alanine--D-glutamate ligase [Alphaproteobacteria bacterium]|nr:UDP-N-acetylmuramoyl-L-alanine--D-glutamate ligase [Alphaproteobacteria bacterium]
MQPQTFIFDSYRFDAATGVLRLAYGYDNGLQFEETLTFKPPFATHDGALLDRVFRLLFLLAGVSYYKAYVPEKLVCKAFALDVDTARWMEQVYTSGLGEFAYRNGLDLRGRIHFEAQSVASPAAARDAAAPSKRALVPVGGGKDSVVTVEALKKAGFDVTCFALGGPAGPAQPIADCIQVSGLPHIYVSRVISPALIELNKTGVYNGHVPITAILSCIAIASAVLYGFDAVVMSNEHSASAPNAMMGELEINHQYSKSFAFEQDLAKRVPEIRYFSFLRPCTEVEIARRFAEHKKYHGVFRSCNTAFKQDVAQRGTRWCCNCPKCRFVFLALSPFMDPSPYFGKNMLDDATQAEGFAELCGLSAIKPFECVGEVGESAAVMHELSKRETWKDTAVVKALGARTSGDFKMLFEFLRPHAIPLEYLGALKSVDVVIWGTGKEGRAAGAFVKDKYKPHTITFVDETESDDPAVITDYDHRTEVVLAADVLVKSPGVSLYHPLIVRAQKWGVQVTSLLNLWWPTRPKAKTICVTGTKGKSTTSALLGHVLKAMGCRVAVLGNIGVPVTEAPEDVDYLVLEMSSYQTANFQGVADIAAVTSLYPEHLNWHGDLQTYYRDKLNLLEHADIKIVHPQVASVYNDLPHGFFVCANAVTAPNEYLARPHNLANVGMVLTIVKALGLDTAKALAAMADFKGLPHRQQELGEKDGILFVDDSIATTPQAAIAAMEVYAGKPVTLIAGGFDRGIDYQPLVEYVVSRNINAVIGLGPSGQRILDGLRAKGYANASAADTIDEVVREGMAKTPKGGVLLLSPAAPSFGLFKDYVERGHKFAEAAGF